MQEAFPFPKMRIKYTRKQIICDSLNVKEDKSTPKFIHIDPIDK